MFQEPRSTDQRGGGVGIMFKKSLNIRPVITELTFTSFECVEYLLKSNSVWLRILVVYRPPPSTANGLTPVTQFLSEFTVLLEHLALLPAELLILGDFNFHVDDTSDRNAVEFLSLLDTFNLSQHISEPTHKSGRTLDLLITKVDSVLLSDVLVHTPWISDHSTIQFRLINHQETMFPS